MQPQLPNYSIGADPDIVRNGLIAQQQQPWQYNGATRKVNELDVPILYLEKEYETDGGKFLNQLRRQSDYMMFNPRTLFDFDNPNQAYLTDMAAGKLRKEDYFMADTLYGDSSGTPTKDNHVFEVPKSALNGQILGQPLQFGVKNASAAFAEKKIIDGSKAAAKQAMQMMLEQAKATGMNMDFARDKNVPLPKSLDDLFDFMTGEQQVESTMFKILKHIDYEQKFQNLSALTNDNAFDLNARFGMIDVVNNELVLKALDCNQVNWMANKRVQTLEDPAVLGVQVNEYMTITELLNQFASKLNTGTGIMGLTNFLDKVIRGRTIGYDPTGSYWNEYGLSGWGIGSALNDLNENRIQYTPQQINWMRRMFYPGQMHRSGIMLSVLVQRNYVQMMRMRRYVIERVEDGVSRPATDREFEAWRDTDFTRDLDIRITLVGKNEDVKRKNIRDMMRPQVVEFTRVGHDTFFDVGYYKHQQDTDTEQIKKNLPVFGQISYKKSFAKRGENMVWRVNVLMQRVDELLQQVGLTQALLIDDAQGEEPLEYLFNGKKTGVLRYNSTLMQSGNQAQLRHLTTVALGNHMSEVQIIMGEVRSLTQEYGASIGLGPQVSGQGANDQYVGLRKTQLNIANQQLLITEFLLDNTNFINQALQRAADIGRVVYARNGVKVILFNQGEQELLTLTKELSDATFGIYMESALSIQNKLDAINSLIEQMAPSAGPDQMVPLLEGRESDNYAEKIAIIKRVNKEAQQRADQAQQQAQAQFQQEQQAKQQAADRLYQLENKKLDWEREKLLLTLNAGEAKDNRKGVMSDIDTIRQREETLVSAHLGQEQSTLEAQQQQALQQQQGEQQAQQQQAQSPKE